MFHISLLLSSVFVAVRVVFGHIFQLLRVTIDLNPGGEHPAFGIFGHYALEHAAALEGRVIVVDVI